MTDTFMLEIGETVVEYHHPEDGPSSRRQYFVCARRTVGDRFWADFYHNHSFRWEEGARNLLDRIISAWGENPTEDRFVNNPNWTPNTDPNPLTDLEPFGYEWMREQEDRHYGRG